MIFFNLRYIVLQSNSGFVETDMKVFLNDE